MVVLFAQSRIEPQPGHPVQFSESPDCAIAVLVGANIKAHSNNAAPRLESSQLVIPKEPLVIGLPPSGLQTTSGILELFNHLASRGSTRGLRTRPHIT